MIGTSAVGTKPHLGGVAEAPLGREFVFDATFAHSPGAIEGCGCPVYSGGRTTAASSEPGHGQVNEAVGGGGDGVTGSRLGHTYYSSHAPNGDTLLMGGKWGDGVGSGIDITYSILGLNSSTAYYSATYYSGGQEFSNSYLPPSGLASTIATVLARISNVCNVSFTLVDDSATAGDLRYGVTGYNTPTAKVKDFPGGYVYGSGPQEGDVWLGANYWNYWANAAPGTYGFTTIMHETGHALGLKHPHDSINGYGTSTIALNRSIMSYRDYDGDNLGGYTSGYFPTTPMIEDIAALQYLYGAKTSYHAGNDTYTYFDNIVYYEAIWDAGGTDTIDCSNMSTAVNLDLNPGQFLRVGAGFYNGQTTLNDGYVGIAYGAWIENAIGGSASDTIKGNSADNQLSGGEGNDTIRGGTGLDSLLGGSGDDWMSVDDFTLGDMVRGGAGWDTLRVELYGVTADLVYLIEGQSALAVRDGANRLLADEIELLELIAGTGNNILNASNVGPGLSVRLYGQEGNDYLHGGSGNDLLSGYNGNDTLFGGSGDDTLQDWAGDDLLDGGAGNDYMQGGFGNDTYVVRDQLDNVVESAFSGMDKVLALIDWTLGDYLELLDLAGAARLGVGNAWVNEINGTAANNWLDGKGGADTMRGGAGDDTYIFETIGDYAHEAAGDGVDTVILITAFDYTLTANVERLWLGGSGDFQANGNDIANEVIGNAGNNILNGGLGADTMYGGRGNDLYIIDNIGDVVSEVAGEGTDTVNSLIDYTLNVNVENLNIIGTGNINAYGSNVDNVINGNTGNNTLTGEAGNDILNSGGGADNLVGGSGNDLLNGNADADRLEGGTGDDTLNGGAGDDLFVFGPGSGHDTIQDFTAGAGTDDRIDLRQYGFADFNAVLAATSDVAGSAVITLSGADDVTLSGVLRAQLHENDFLL